MGFGWKLAVVALALLLSAPARAQQPSAVVNVISEAMEECRGAYGRPSLQQGFETVADLNGDGQLDYLLDYTHLNCDGAASFFCGAGCPLVIVLSAPGRYAVEPQGLVQGWSLESGGTLPVLVLTLSGSSCGRGAADGCEVRLAWNGRQLARVGRATPAASASAPMAARPGPLQDGAKTPAANAAPGSTWQLRRSGDGRPVAVVAGPGAVRAVTVLCHEGVPIMVLALRARPPAGPVTVSFAGRSGQAALPLEPGGGENWIADLRTSALPRLLSGRDPSLDLAINGGRQGWVALNGSTRAVREALQPCLPM